MVRIKLYCYVDETGQDGLHKFFLVSVVITDQVKKDKLGEVLENLEKETGKNKLKWTKTKTDIRKDFIEKVGKIKELARNKVELEVWRGVIPSRPNLTAHKILDGIYVPLLTSALEFHSDPKLPTQVFIAYHDYASGIIEVVHDVLQAEDDIRGISETVATETISQFEQAHGEPIPAWATSQMYLHLLQNAQARSKLLIQDSRGFDLVNQTVEEIRFDSQLPPQSRSFHRILAYQEPQLMLAGAEFAQKAYQELYPLTQ